MEQKDFEKIIEDYDFACTVVKRCGNDHTLSSLYKLFNELGYHTYNFSENGLFDMEIGNLILTYVAGNGISENIQIWNNEEWCDTTIKNFKNLFTIQYPQQTELEELRQQYAYECECNKQFVACQKENEDLICAIHSLLDDRNLGLAKLSYIIYKKEFYKDHDTTDEPVCFDEFLQNEWQDEEVKKYYLDKLGEKTSKKILDECNMTDLKHNYFNDWLMEALDYQCNVVFEKDEYTEEYKQLMDEKSVDIQFVEDKEDKDFPVAVFMKIKGNGKVEYVDNISQSLYERRYE